jgi:hypothetical protein
MFRQNASCAAERAQDAADFGGEGGGTNNQFPADADKCGHVTYRLRSRVIGTPSAGDPNFRDHLKDAIEGLYGTGIREAKDEDKARRPMEVDQEEDNDKATDIEDDALFASMVAACATKNDDEATDIEDDALFARMVAAHATENNQQGLSLGQGHGGRGQQIGGGGHGGKGVLGGGEGVGGGEEGEGEGEGVGGGGGEPVKGRDDRVMLQNPVTLQEMEDGIVNKGVYSKYCNEVILFAAWIHGHQASWFTQFGKTKYDELLVLQEGENQRQRRTQIKDEWMTMLRNARHNPIINVDSITPVVVMEGYISRIANQTTLKLLSPAKYRGERMGVFHLIHCHNSKGPSKDFLDKMTTLWKGFS